MKSRLKAKLRKNRIIAFFVGIVAVFFCIILITQIADVRSRNEELEVRKDRLQQQIAEQERRQAELEDEEKYVRTREYIEEKAKALGYVYPDEIIFKQED